MTERQIDLVVPLAQKATDMRITETTDICPDRSSAVSQLIGEGLRLSDVDSTTRPVTRISTMAIRITTTPTTSCAPGPSANQYDRHHADFSFEDLIDAYFDCRRNKRNSPTALAFEVDLEHNLLVIKSPYPIKDGSFVNPRKVCRDFWKRREVA